MYNLKEYRDTSIQQLKTINVFGANRSSELAAISTSDKMARNRVLFWQGEPQAREIEIVEGVVRAVHLCQSGERQVLTFFWPGTVILPNVGHGQSYTAETVTNCIVRSRKSTPDTLSGSAISASEQVLQEMLQLFQGINRRSALSRIAWFLLRMREHLSQTPPESDVLKFLIPRSDIADHLGLSLETVSRGLTELKNRGIIDLPSRKTIRFRSVAQLARIAKT